MKRRSIIVVACLAMTSLLAGCFPGVDLTPEVTAAVAPTPLESPIPAPNAQGPAVPSLFGATADGYAAAVPPGFVEGLVGTAAGNSCPSVRDPAMPPCTQWAGVSGAYAAAAYRCVAGMGLYKRLQYPSLRTCMDGYIVQQSNQIVTTTGFYVVDLYKYWRVDSQVRDMWWAFVSIYINYFQYHIGYIGEKLVCFYITAPLGATAFMGATEVAGFADIACSFAMTIAREEFT